jgi:hypothetical protein
MNITRDRETLTILKKELFCVYNKKRQICFTVLVKLQNCHISGLTTDLSEVTIQ